MWTERDQFIWRMSLLIYQTSSTLDLVDTQFL